MPDTSYSANNPTTMTVQEDIMVAAEIGPMVAPGMIIPFAGNGDPIGYLLCDGRTIKRADYPALFAAIGTLYGAGDGSTTFKIPNLVARFIEGAKTSGTIKEAGVPNITGFCASFPYDAENHEAYSDGNGIGTFGPTGAFYTGGWARSGKKDGREGHSTHFDASRCSAVYGKSDTVQPAAVTMKYCIRY